MNTQNSLYIDVKVSIEKLLQQQNIVNYVVRECDGFIKGANYTSEIIIVDVEVENLSGLNKLHFFVKVAKKEVEFREMMSIKEKYETEMYTYKYIFSQFVEFQQENNILNHFESYPHFYMSSNEYFKEMVISENLLEKGYKISDKLMTLDYDHSLLAIKELAKFHALSFAIKDKKPHIFQEISKHIGDKEFHGKFAKTSQTCFETFLPMYIDVLRAGKHTVISQKLTQIQETIFEKARMLVKDEFAEPYTVINHGDIWVTNLLFKYNELSRPAEVRFVDFQGTKVCSPASDISQLIFTSVNAETRCNQYDNLISEYYKSFATFLIGLGGDPNKLFPYHILKSHLKKYSFLGLITSIRIISAISIPPEQFPKFENAVDGSEMGKMFYNAKRDTSLFQENITSVFLDYFNFGYDF